MKAIRRKTLMEIYQRLYDHYGPQGWWPGRTKTEIMVGAILTQNTAWSNVVKALHNLKKRNLLNMNALYRVKIDPLSNLLKPSGYFRVKARRLKNFVCLWKEGLGNSWKRVKKTSTKDLRQLLLGVNGVGNETADSILLYALDRPVFVVDLYTKRLLTRHRMLGPRPSYEVVQGTFHRLLPKSLKMFNEFHALIVKVGHEHCRKTPQCKGCPLEDFLPDASHRSR